MRVTQFLLSTTKETPADATLTSHRLMIRSGMIQKLGSGLYTWLPLGLRVLRKVESIIREEMNALGALELLMPSVQPGELWRQSDRWDKYGAELLRFLDRHGNEFCYGPTHEEVISYVLSHELKSYKQLPKVLYQIQTKFRDEIRPRFGVMRAREFLMKDAYSFHTDQASLEQTYEQMYQAYKTIFTRIGLEFRAVKAHTGNIGGSSSHEFHALAQSGEDCLVYSDQGDYAANLELATAWVSKDPLPPPPASSEKLEKFATPGMKTILDLATHKGIAPARGVKTLIVKGAETPLVALVLRGDHQLNELKAEALPEVYAPFQKAEESEIQQLLGASPGSIGVINLNIPCIVDHSAAELSDFVCGANEDGFHYRHVYWGRDAPLTRVADIRTVVEGDRSPDGKGTLFFTRGIELGHLFQLGDLYTRSLGVTILQKSGKTMHPLMGCFGIGVSRTVAAVIEQSHDAHGIIWPEAIAPFQVALIPLNASKSYRVYETAERLFHLLREAQIEVLLDDRKERPGVKFAEMDLIGIPHHILISERGMDKGVVEYKSRAQGRPTSEWKIEQVVAKTMALLQAQGKGIKG